MEKKPFQITEKQCCQCKCVIQEVVLLKGFQVRNLENKINEIVC